MTTPPTIQRRELLSCASPPQLSPTTLAQLAHAEYALSRLHRAADSASCFAPRSACLDGSKYSPTQLVLHHHLSDHIDRFTGAAASHIDDRSTDEYRVFRQLLPNYLGLDASDEPAEFSGFVETAATAIHRRGVGLRHGPMMVKAPNNEATVIALPSAEDARQQLVRIGALFRTADRALPPIGLATWKYVLLLNAHPLHDGNGRLARILFNLDLARLGAPLEAYIPICAAIRNSRGGYEIRLRQAEMLGDWNPIMRFMSHVIRMSAMPMDYFS